MQTSPVAELRNCSSKSSIRNEDQAGVAEAVQAWNNIEFREQYITIGKESTFRWRSGVEHTMPSLSVSGLVASQLKRVSSTLLSILKLITSITAL
jgi:hypothetical protein